VAPTASRHYQNQEIMSASPIRLVVMLYERAIASLNEAVDAIAAGDVERRWQANKKAIEIITHLALTLDFEQGGEIARNLDNLYRFMLRVLLDVDLRNDPKPARHVIGLLEPLCESWKQLAKGAASGGKAPATHSAESLATPPSSGIAISA
jgi:flagellar protein FliS